MSVPWEEYFQLILEEKLLAEKPPVHEDGYINHATQLLEKKREMVEMEEALQAKKEEFQVKMSALKQRREALDQKEDALKESMVRFDKFLKFEEIPELMARFSGLSETRAILTEHEQALHKAVEDARAELLKLVEEKNDEILHQNNHVADLQVRLEEVRTQALQWESKWVHIQNTAAQKTLLLGQIKMAALNLFQIVCKQKKEVPALAVEDTEEQLEQVWAPKAPDAPKCISQALEVPLSHYLLCASICK
ncbi:cilia- and flagella-associated protein 73 isoform X4 [Antechinus flavipes]|uniref:cilia- and flagella-associated protein 73 isoform X4 n=1 Tax=Antechinus flavipes TaxID=38775 RepID=UPI00223653B9|nr:cilia- and flagella-associated protein 73 isoform X4 [Antechinus flavipes]